MASSFLQGPALEGLSLKDDTDDEKDGVVSKEWIKEEDYPKLVQDPTSAWEELNRICPHKVHVKPLPDKSLGPWPAPDVVRFVCISDTHDVSKNLKVPSGDVLIHAGDFTMEGFREEVERFMEFLQSQPHKHKIVIAGNHDLPFDPKIHKKFVNYYGDRSHEDREVCRSMVEENCTYLEDSEVTVEGYRIYGAPWQPVHARWAFTLDRGPKLKEKWRKIPNGVDILVTHGPPLGYGDHLGWKGRSGCLDLLYEIKHRIKPKFHVYGHIHEGYGVTTDGSTTFINAAICDVRYRPKHKPIVFDLPRIEPSIIKG